MKAFAFAALVLATPMAAQAATPQPVDKATDIALRQCVEHGLGTGSIIGQNGAILDAKGLVYQRDAPPFLSQTQSTPMGRAEYAKSPSTDGEIWDVAYDSGACMVVTAGTSVAPIEKVYADYFAQPTMWRAERVAPGAKGERKLQYVHNYTRVNKLIATVSLRDDEGVSSVTIRRQTR